MLRLVPFPMNLATAYSKLRPLSLPSFPTRQTHLHSDHLELVP